MAHRNKLFYGGANSKGKTPLPHVDAIPTLAFPPGTVHLRFFQVPWQQWTLAGEKGEEEEDMEVQEEREEENEMNGWEEREVVVE